MKLHAIAMGSLLLFSGFALAQDTDAKKPESDRPAASDTSHAEKEIAAIKLKECRNEVELAKFAQQKTQNAEVKEFAARMIKDHTEACKDLEKWAGGAHAAGATRSDATAKEKEETTEDKPGARLELQTKRGGTVGVDFNAGKGAAAGSGSFNWVAIHQEMADKCLAVAKKELTAKEGAEFDKCYIGMQVGAHQKMIIADEVLAKYVSPEAREKLEKCKATATEHLEAAKSIMKSLEDKPAARVTSRE